jgi:hypothetical protein
MVDQKEILLTVGTNHGCEKQAEKYIKQVAEYIKNKNIVKGDAKCRRRDFCWWNPPQKRGEIGNRW